MNNVKVSVVLPSYNHARFLPRRIESILNQTFSDFELLILDDCSPDNSAEVIAHYAKQDSRIRAVPNEKNSGNTFIQWNKGISLAKGEYIWIAESDDYASIDLLARLVSVLEQHPSVGLAYCDSITVDEKNTELAELKYHYCESMGTDLWMNDFVWKGSDFVKSFMPFINVIPNASGIVLRKQAVLATGPASSQSRLVGDWLYWIQLLSAYDVAYIAQPLNYFRTHSNNVRSKTTLNGGMLEEASSVLLKIQELLGHTEENNRATRAIVDKYFDEVIYGKVPISRNIRICNNFNLLLKQDKSNMLNEWKKFLFDNNLKGIKMIIGDGFVYRYLPVLNRHRYKGKKKSQS